jgi:hypothetical protein
MDLTDYTRPKASFARCRSSSSLWRQEAIRASTTHIAEGLNPNRSLGAAAALSLWGASPVVRDAVVDHLLNSPARLQAAGTDWVQAYTSIESEATARLVDRLRDRLAKPDLDANTRRSLIYAYGSAAARLDPPEAAKAASDLRDRLAKPELDADTEMALVDAEVSLASVPATHPSQEQLEELRLALASVAWPLRNPDDSPAWEKLEKISGRRFEHDTHRLLEWTNSCCGLVASDARLQLRP